MAWRNEGGKTRGTIIGEGEAYPFVIEDGQVRVRLPFEVDQGALREALTQDGWAIALEHDRLESQGWGPEYDIEGYYPCWVWSDPKTGETIFAYPPEDYRLSGDGTERGLTSIIDPDGDDGEDAPSHEPVFGPKALDEFERWIPYIKQAAKQRP